MSCFHGIHLCIIRCFFCKEQTISTNMKFVTKSSQIEAACIGTVSLCGGKKKRSWNFYLAGSLNDTMNRTVVTVPASSSHLSSVSSARRTLSHGSHLILRAAQWRWASCDAFTDEKSMPRGNVSAFPKKYKYLDAVWHAPCALATTHNAQRELWGQAVLNPGPAAS